MTSNVELWESEAPWDLKCLSEERGLVKHYGIDRYGLGMKIGRNETCICGSGLRFKHCCGALLKGQPGVDGPLPEGATVLQLVLEADEDGLQNGEEPKGRAMKSVLRIAHRIRPQGGTILIGPEAPPFMRRVHDLIGSLYRPADIGMGSLHVGAIMFRDIFARIDIPIAWGSLSLDPLRQSDLTPAQQRWLCSRPMDYAIFYDQFLDLTDFAYGLDDLKNMQSIPEVTKTYLNLAHFQLEAAAATVTAQCDLRGAIQSSLLAAELSLKAAILTRGIPEEKLRRSFGHDYKKMIDYLRVQESSIDHKRVLRVVEKFPIFVTNRYSKDQPTRVGN